MTGHNYVMGSRSKALPKDWPSWKSGVVLVTLRVLSLKLDNGWADSPAGDDIAVLIIFQYNHQGGD